MVAQFKWATTSAFFCAIGVTRRSHPPGPSGRSWWACDSGYRYQKNLTFTLIGECRPSESRQCPVAYATDLPGVFDVQQVVLFTEDPNFLCNKLVF